MSLEKLNAILTSAVCVLLAGLTVAVLLPGSQRSGESEGDADGVDDERVRALRVTTEPVRMADSYEERRRYSGSIRAGSIVDLAFTRAGRIDGVLVAEGDSVEKGATLARLDDSLLVSLLEKLQEREKDLEESLEALKSAPRSGGGGSAEAAQGIESELAQLEREIEQMEANIEDCKLDAPFSAAVASVLLKEGAVAAAGHPVLRLYGSEKMEVWVGLPPEVASEKRRGYFGDVWIGSTKHRLQVTRVLPEVEVGSRVRTVVFDLPGDKENAPLPGEIAYLELVREVPERGFSVPFSALAQGSRGQWSVFVFEPDSNTDGAASGFGTVASHRVEVIHLEGANRAWVRADTLDNGAEIIAEGGYRVVPGQRVRLASADDQARNGPVFEESAERAESAP